MLSSGGVEYRVHHISYKRCMPRVGSSNTRHNALAVLNIARRLSLLPPFICGLLKSPKPLSSEKFYSSGAVAGCKLSKVRIGVVKLRKKRKNISHT